MRNITDLIAKLEPLGVVDWHWTNPSVLKGSECGGPVITDYELAPAAKRCISIRLSEGSDDGLVAQLLHEYLPMHIDYKLGVSMASLKNKGAEPTFLVDEILLVCSSGKSCAEKRQALNTLLETPDGNAISLRDISILRARLAALEAAFSQFTAQQEASIAALVCNQNALANQLTEQQSSIESHVPKKPDIKLPPA